MPRAPRPVLAAMLTAGVLLTGCSDGSPSAAGTPSASPSATASSAAPSPVPTVDPAPAAPALVHSRRAAGQQAFARHVMDLWGYALRTDDPKPLAATAAGKQACGGCAPLARALASRRRHGWTVDFPGVTVRRVRLAAQGGDRVARATVDIPASDSYTTDGTFRNTSPAHKGATFVVRMRYVRTQWRLVSFTVG
jgi:hypothetical protein